MIRQKFDADLVSCLPLTSKAFAVVQLSTWRESEKIPYINCLPDSNHCLNFLLDNKKGKKTYCISWVTHLRQTTVRTGVSTPPLPPIKNKHLYFMPSTPSLKSTNCARPIFQAIPPIYCFL